MRLLRRPTCRAILKITFGCRGSVEDHHDDSIGVPHPIVTSQQCTCNQSRIYYQIEKNAILVDPENVGVA
jgi:hypothetical protein